MVTYMSYFRNMPRVYLLDIETGTQEVVGNFPGMTFAPRFSPDGKNYNELLKMETQIFTQWISSQEL